MDSTLDTHRVERLLDVGRALVSELDLEAVLRRLLEVACELTGARYAALGILDPERRELERFLTRGIDEAAYAAIGQLPRGRGILGLLIEDPRPLRLADIGEHPHSYGFPAGHPAMTTFLGVPILLRGRAWGNLYLTEKADGPFDEADEAAVVVVAEWAAIAIDNARLYEESERRRVELERAVRSLEATTEIAHAVGGETRLERVLELIVKRARALVDARLLTIMLADGDELVVAAAAGDVPDRLRGRRVSAADSVAGRVLAGRRPARLSALSAALRPERERLAFSAESALVVPLLFRGRASGVLAAYDRLAAGPDFDAEDERLLAAFGASAATAVATAKSVEEDRLRQSIVAAEQERRRWARELHDETLQGLGAMRVLLSSAVRRGDDASLRATMVTAIEHLTQEIANLRTLITELRPAALDELGVQPALETLVERVASAEGIEIECRLELAHRHDPELESTIYRLVQEALTNAVKHAGARRVVIELREGEGSVEVAVRDDGEGFDPGIPSGGFGLIGMRERVALASGTLSLRSGPRGTSVHASFPTAGASGGGRSPAEAASG